ncbi:MAG TPA: acyltransferase family protein [Acidimicrobiales bacterium]|nr:acyltransferase family protein [Acidimicrobiales bacterium]
MRYGRGPGSRFRRDIEGMRAVAILAVVLYHAHVGLLRGGFTGVDDFYVISGFLITGLLWRELEGGSRLSFRSFYGRRVRRLLPMSFVVLVATALASTALLPPLQTHAVLKDGISSALYVSNYRFAALQTNYLTSSALPSPFQQYWSLSLEEQFYLIWPALLLAGSLLWMHRRRRPSPSRLGAATVLGALGVASFALGVWLTRVSQPWAFFSLPARAWELAAGGLVAFAAPWLGTLSRRRAAVLGWVGLAAVVGSALILSGSVPYPGVAALTPVLGTAAVIASGCAAPHNGPILVLGRIGAQVLGRVSYSWYLWHWPVLILAPSLIGHTLSLAANLSLVALSLVLAVISFVIIENPLRRSTWLRDQPRRALRLGGVVTTAAVALCLLSIVTLPSLGGHGIARQAKLASAPAVKPRSLQNTASVADRDPYTTALIGATAQVQHALAQSLPVNDVPANLTPSLPHADADEPPVFVDGCLDSYLPTGLGTCDFGDTSSHTSIVLFGDSHAAMWFPAVDSAAHQFGLNLFTWTKATCPPLVIPIFSPVLGRTYAECDEWRQNVLARIAQVHPTLVILGVARHYTDIYGFTPYSTQWLQGLSQMVSSIRQLGPRVLVIGPVPKPPFSVPGCLSVHLTSAAACTVPLSQGLNVPGKLAEEHAVAAAGGSYLDPDPWFCTPDTCAVMVDNLLAYRDDNHITATYASYLAPAVTDELGRVLNDPAPTPTPALTPTPVPAKAFHANAGPSHPSRS